MWFHGGRSPYRDEWIPHVYVYAYVRIVCFDSSSPIFFLSLFFTCWLVVWTYTVSLPGKKHNKYITSITLTTLKRTKLEIVSATSERIRGRRQRSPSNRWWEILYVYASRSAMLFSSMTILFWGVCYEDSIGLLTLSHGWKEHRRVH